jgi:hypothetical protein
MNASGRYHQPDLDKTWQMLRYIPADDRDVWIKMGMALKSEYGDEGFSLLDQWSQTADNYDHKAISAVWRSFKGSGVSLGSLIYLARQGGWSASAHSMVFQHQNGNGTCTCSFGKHNQRAAAYEIDQVYQPSTLVSLIEQD